ncbi:GIY-YIG nuclease family protein [Sphingomonas oligophenolica]|uniref:GIY-YIG nuclease family protein n=1 Tax=Sphingomonas oligophenolica TaxID=301154 RepID=A0A502CKV8_9SPHN|nr:GIY-YIG nuclease family protein [Sphingomonas oligophenolica]TPG12321.1 GIY-YIG nuclease family protein [Sphingomonas oligophenolica]
MAFWAYLLRCGDGSFYAGHCDNLESRIGAHRSGRGSDYTARRQPVWFAWAQDFPSRLEALEAERRIKGWSHAKKEALVAGDWERLSQLARACGTRPSTSSGRTAGVDPTAPSYQVRAERVEARAPSEIPTA